MTAVGNAAGQGAVMALLSTDLREQANLIARTAEHVELSARSDFMEQFVEDLAL
ncbi:MAG: ASKHA domain-containing protein [Chloroflexota bacterium]